MATTAAKSKNDRKAKPRDDGPPFDPTIPVGNSPPRPFWPVIVTGLLWLGMVVFLLYMLVAFKHQSLAQ